MKLSELAAYSDTDVAKVLRDCEVESAELCAKIRGRQALTYLEKPKFLPMLDKQEIVAVICTKDMVEAVSSKVNGILVSDAPKFAFYNIYNYLAAQRSIPNVPTRIGANCQISPQAVIAPNNVVIGDHVVVEASAVIMEHVTIGNDVHIFAGTVIGAKSFNPSRYKARTVLLQDCGEVCIGDHVDICSQSVIVRGVLPGEVTHLEDFTKVDTLIHIAHGVHIGKRSFIAAGTVLGGNSDIGQDVWIGINATVSNRVCIGDGARVSLGAVVTKDVPAGQTVTGNFAIDHQTFLKNLKDSL